MKHIMPLIFYIETCVLILKLFYNKFKNKTLIISNHRILFIIFFMMVNKIWVNTLNKIKEIMLLDKVFWELVKMCSDICVSGTIQYSHVITCIGT